MPASSSSSPPPPQPSRQSEQNPRLIELGFVLQGYFSQTQRDLLEQARHDLQQQLQTLFPQFDWRLPWLQKPERSAAEAVEPMYLLRAGLDERETRRWDFALVWTDKPLHSHYRSHALATPSQALGVAAVSLAQLSADGQATTPPVRRLIALALHLLGDLNGLPHSNDADSLMYAPATLEDWDRPRRFSAAEREALARELGEVADLRLEEHSHGQGKSLPGFYLRAIWHLRGEIGSAVLQAKPWAFPLRFSRLSTGALSALLVLIMTAEVWDLGMSQPLPRVGLLSLLVLFGASAYILIRQQLLLRRGYRQRTEQTVLGNTAIGLIVITGMLTAYLVLLALTLTLAWSLFGSELVAGWAASLDGDIGVGNYFAMAQLIAALGLLIGALGASFEGRYYFQHVIFVDEEL